MAKGNTNAQLIYEQVQGFCVLVDGVPSDTLCVVTRLTKPDGIFLAAQLLNNKLTPVENQENYLIAKCDATVNAVLDLEALQDAFEGALENVVVEVSQSGDWVVIVDGVVEVSGTVDIGNPEALAEAIATALEGLEVNATLNQEQLDALLDAINAIEFTDLDDTDDDIRPVSPLCYKWTLGESTGEFTGFATVDELGVVQGWTSTSGTLSPDGAEIVCIGESTQSAQVLSVQEYCIEVDGETVPSGTSVISQNADGDIEAVHYDVLWNVIPAPVGEVCKTYTTKDFQQLFCRTNEDGVKEYATEYTCVPVDSLGNIKVGEAKTFYKLADGSIVDELPERFELCEPGTPDIIECETCNVTIFATYATVDYTITGMSFGGNDVSSSFTLPVDGNNAPAFNVWRDELRAFLASQGITETNYQLGRDGFTLSYTGEKLEVITDPEGTIAPEFTNCTVIKAEAVTVVKPVEISNLPEIVKPSPSGSVSYTYATASADATEQSYGIGDVDAGNPDNGIKFDTANDLSAELTQAHQTIRDCIASGGVANTVITDQDGNTVDLNLTYDASILNADGSVAQYAYEGADLVDIDPSSGKVRAMVVTCNSGDLKTYSATHDECVNATLQEILNKQDCQIMRECVLIDGEIYDAHVTRNVKDKSVVCASTISGIEIPVDEVITVTERFTPDEGDIVKVNVEENTVVMVGAIAETATSVNLLDKNSATLQTANVAERSTSELTGTQKLTLETKEAISSKAIRVQAVTESKG